MSRPECRRFLAAVSSCVCRPGSAVTAPFAKSCRRSPRRNAPIISRVLCAGARAFRAGAHIARLIARTRAMRTPGAPLLSVPNTVLHSLRSPESKRRPGSRLSAFSLPRFPQCQAPRCAFSEILPSRTIRHRLAALQSGAGGHSVRGSSTRAGTLPHGPQFRPRRRSLSRRLPHLPGREAAGRCGAQGRARRPADARRSDGLAPGAQRQGLDCAQLADRVGRPRLDGDAEIHLGRGAGARQRAAPDPLRYLHVRAGADGLRHRGPEAAPPAAHPLGRAHLLPGLFRARRRLRSRLAQDPLRGA